MISRMLYLSIFLAGQTTLLSAQQLSWSSSPHAAPGPTAMMQMNGTALVEVGENTFAYSVGGNTGPRGKDIDAIWYAPIDGPEIGPWLEAEASLNGRGIVYHTRSTVGYEGRLFIVGGRFNDDDGFDERFDGIRVMTPSEDGNIPATQVIEYESEAGAIEPPLDTLESAVVIVESNAHENEGVLYVIGGNGTDAVRSLRIDKTSGAIIGADPGSLPATALTQEAALPATVGFAPAVHQDGRIYLLGGNPPSDVVFWTAVGDDDRLAPWKETSAKLPEARLDSGAVSFHGTIYLIGGTALDNTTTRNTVLRAEISEEGDIVGWVEDTPLPIVPGLRRVGAFATEDAIHLIGGRINSTSFSTAVWSGVLMD